MPGLILGTATALAVSMSATAEPITAHLVLTIEGGVAESEVTPLFGPLHAGDTLNAVVTFDPGQADRSSDQFNGTFESVSGSIGAIRLTHGEMATGTGLFPDSSNFFSGNVGGEPAGSGAVRNRAGGRADTGAVLVAAAGHRRGVHRATPLAARVTDSTARVQTQSGSSTASRFVCPAGRSPRCDQAAVDGGAPRL